MSGRRVQVVSERADYIVGLFSDEGLVPGEWRPLGGCEFFITDAAWARLSPEIQAEIGRHVFPTTGAQPQGVNRA